MLVVGQKRSLPALPLLLCLCALGSTQASSADDVTLSTPELIDKYGYSMEEHFVTSDTGYILRLFRIPHGRTGVASRGPVMLVHGLQGSSSTWFYNQSESLAFLMADNGYDVWLVNQRGNLYSRNHTTLDPNKAKFWKFSWHEQGSYDTPAIIDYILNETGERCVSYVGHSMGTTVFFVMASEKPEYTRKICMGFMLAPVAYVKHTPNAAIRAVAPLSDAFYAVVGPLLHYEIPAGRSPTTASDHPLYYVGATIINAFIGAISSNTNNTTQGLGFQGGSVGQPVHYGQEVVSGRFCQFDHGVIRNMMEYGSLSPPDYNVSQIACPVIAMYSAGDCAVGPKDVRHLRDVTPENVQFRLVPEKNFSHNDFISGDNVTTLIYQPILAAMDGENIGATRDFQETPRSECSLLRTNTKTQKKTSKAASKTAKLQRRRSGRHLRV